MLRNRQTFTTASLARIQSSSEPKGVNVIEILLNEMTSTVAKQSQTTNDNVQLSTLL